MTVAPQGCRPAGQSGCPRMGFMNEPAKESAVSLESHFRLGQRLSGGEHLPFASIARQLANLKSGGSQCPFDIALATVGGEHRPGEEASCKSDKDIGCPKLGLVLGRKGVVIDGMEGGPIRERETADIGVTFVKSEPRRELHRPVPRTIVQLTEIVGWDPETIGIVQCGVILGT